MQTMIMMGGEVTGNATFPIRYRFDGDTIEVFFGAEPEIYEYRIWQDSRDKYHWGL